MSDNPLQIEPTLRDAVPNGGYPKTIPIDVMTAFKANQIGDAIPNTGTGNWQRHVIDLGAANMGGLIADATSGASDVLYYRQSIPDDYAELEDKCRLVVIGRKLFTSSDNADLALACAGTFHGPTLEDVESIASQSHTFAQTATSEAGNTDWDDWEEIVYTFDGEGLKSGGVLELFLAPNEAVGTNGEIQIIGARLEYYAHATIPQADRYWTST